MHINPEMARRYGQPDEAWIGVERGCTLSIGPHLHEAHSTVDLLTALFAQCQKVVPARLKPQLPLPKIDNRLVPQRPAQGYLGRLHMQYELNGSSLLSVSAYRAVLGDQLTALLRTQGVLTT